jgi:hypothetical protein
MNEHEDNLRDLASMFAMAGLLMNNENYSMPEVVDKAHQLAEYWMNARNRESLEDQGIAVLKPKRKYERKTTD